MAFIEGKQTMASSLTRTETQRKTPKFTQRQIDSMMFTPPPNLEEVKRIDLPIGTWQQDGGAVVFEPKPAEEIAAITKPSIRRRLKDALVKIGQIT